MRAYRFSAWQKQPELCEAPVSEPGPGQVLIKVAGAGACHSDLHVMEWPEGVNGWHLPFTMGHENCWMGRGAGAGSRWTEPRSGRRGLRGVGLRTLLQLPARSVLGLAMGTFPFHFRAVPWECAIAATYRGRLPELEEVITLARQGKVRCRTEYFPLENAPEVYDRMRAGTLRGRAVITPNG